MAGVWYQLTNLSECLVGSNPRRSRIFRLISNFFIALYRAAFCVLASVCEAKLRLCLCVLKKTRIAGCASSTDFSDHILKKT